MSAISCVNELQEKNIVEIERVNKSFQKKDKVTLVALVALGAIGAVVGLALICAPVLAVSSALKGAAGAGGEGIIVVLGLPFILFGVVVGGSLCLGSLGGACASPIVDLLFFLDVARISAQSQSLEDLLNTYSIRQIIQYELLTPKQFAQKYEQFIAAGDQLIEQQNQILSRYTPGNAYHSIKILEDLNDKVRQHQCIKKQWIQEMNHTLDAMKNKLLQLETPKDLNMFHLEDYIAMWESQVK